MSLPPSVADFVKVRVPVVHHYTDATGLLGMVSCNELWATESHGMNDRAEVRQGWDFIKNWLARQDDPNNPIVSDLNTAVGWASGNDWASTYFFCASTVEDDANQWRNYGGAASGYAVALDTSTRFAVVTDQRPPPIREDDADGTYATVRARARLKETVNVSSWSRVLYTEDEKNDVLESYLRVCAEQAEQPQEHFDREEDHEAARQEKLATYASDLEALARLMKSEGFAGENEARVIISTFSQHHASLRAGRYGIVTYQRLAERQSDLAELRYDIKPGRGKSTLPILYLTTGPLVDHKTNVMAVDELLERHGHAVEVRESKLDLR